MQSQGFLQTKEWANFQRSLGREVFEYEKNGVSAKIIKHDLPLGRNYLYIPHGPEMDFNTMMGGFKGPTRSFIDYLLNLGLQEKSIFLKAEPLTGNVAQMLVGVGFKRVNKEVQPSKTVLINIQESDINLLSAMHHKTRYNIKVAENHGATVEESKNITAFWRLLKKTTARDEFSSHPKDYYEKLLNFNWGNDGPKVKLFLAKYQDKPAAAAIVLIYNGTGYYLHGASDYEYRAVMAPFMLHWRIIQLLRKAGIENYDLWGIDAKKWPGVTRFKLNWGGRVLDRPGSFDLPISKLWYSAYRIARRIF
ncbi:MAG: peptidoglycan bridge formation glycyltransferase FemA/FemB family protein [Patescibacteria group bacterium]